MAGSSISPVRHNERRAIQRNTLKQRETAWNRAVKHLETVWNRAVKDLETPWNSVKQSSETPWNTMIQRETEQWNIMKQREQSSETPWNIMKQRETEQWNTAVEDVNNKLMLINTLIKKNMKLDIEKLLLIVQEHSVLYDTKNTNYQYIVLKESIWKEMATEWVIMFKLTGYGHKPCLVHFRLHQPSWIGLGSGKSNWFSYG